MYDLVIIGGGPGGLTAGIYAQRANLKTVLLEKMGIGGQICMSDVIENYPGFKSINGIELMKLFEEQARALGLEIKFAEVTKVVDKGTHKEVVTSEETIAAKAVIISTGARPKRLGVAGEAELIGRGVSFCATCDGFFFKGREVAVIGGGDAALEGRAVPGEDCEEGPFNPPPGRIPRGEDNAGQGPRGAELRVAS